MTAAHAGPPAQGFTLLELLLDEQATLTAVERFAQREAAAADAAEATAGGLYEALMPTGLPGAAEQYAFRVDLDACTGCKACVTACHSMNGLDEGETWRRVGLLVGDDPAAPVQQTVTGACHHCEDPGCLAGCPVNAYEKDPVTGIVRHLDDQCIGCKYCTLTCPYDVPQYNERLGIVRKCDMCTGRLSAGEAPACVQGCPNGAISIAIVPSAVGAFDGLLVPSVAGALASADITRPSTRYASRRLHRALRPADVSVARPGHAHWPLAVLLVCVQLSVGLVAVGCAAQAMGVSAAAIAGWWTVALAAAVAGQAAAFLHIGRPRYAYRALLGLRTSWMSREIAALGLYLPLLAGCVGVGVVLPRVAPGWAAALQPLVPWLSGLGLLAGTAGVFASVKIYAVTGRPLWSLRRCTARFVSTAVVLGAGTAAAIALATGAAAVAVALGSLCAAVAVGKLAVERRTRRADLDSSVAALARGARLETGALEVRATLRAGLLLAGVAGLAVAGALAAAGFGPGFVAPVAAVAAASCFAGELLERHLFFAAESARGMPGV